MAITSPAARRLERYEATGRVLFFVTIVAASVFAYASKTDPFGWLADSMSPELARGMRIFNVVLGTLVMGVSLYFSSRMWGSSTTARRDFMFYVFLMQFILVVGAGQALALDLPPNYLAIAVVFTNIGGARVQWHMARDRYPGTRS